MSNYLEEVLSGNEDKYLLPFLWQRGEEESVIRAEMAYAYDSGICAVCVEARPHAGTANRWALKKIEDLL